mmetsp:Transcript_3751/g.7850  ORF Transcript_3751/g.7850 Transcript_3751/m.7850 type:complete len:216 (+) Transcript_3751:242-889(+)
MAILVACPGGVRHRRLRHAWRLPRIYGPVLPLASAPLPGVARPPLELVPLRRPLLSRHGLHPGLRRTPRLETTKLPNVPLVAASAAATAAAPKEIRWGDVRASIGVIRGAALPLQRMRLRLRGGDGVRPHDLPTLGAADPPTASAGTDDIPAIDPVTHAPLGRTRQQPLMLRLLPLRFRDRHLDHRGGRSHPRLDVGEVITHLRDVYRGALSHGL